LPSAVLPDNQAAAPTDAAPRPSGRRRRRRGRRSPPSPPPACLDAAVRWLNTDPAAPRPTAADLAELYRRPDEQRGLPGHPRPTWTKRRHNEVQVLRCLLWASAPDRQGPVSQSAIAGAAGVNRSTVSRIERDLRRWGVLIWLSPDGQEVSVDLAPPAPAATGDEPQPPPWKPGPGEAPIRRIRWTRELLEVRCERPGWRRRIDLAMALLDLPAELRPPEALIRQCLCRRPIANGDAVLESWYAAAVWRLRQREQREQQALAEALDRRRRQEDTRPTGTILEGLLQRYGAVPAGDPKCTHLDRPDPTTSTTAGGVLWPKGLRAGKLDSTAAGDEALGVVVADGLVPDAERAVELYAELGRSAALVGERSPRSVWTQLANLARSRPERSLDELVGLYCLAVIRAGECAARAAAGRRPLVANPAAFAVGIVRRVLDPAA
jgi:transcriptional regulator with XRE-family HTH domain